MKKITSLILGIAIFFSSYASTEIVNPGVSNSTPAPVLDANNIMFPVGRSGQKISLMDLSKISAKDFEAISGRKMNALDKVELKLGQKKLQNQIKEDGTIKTKALKKYAGKMAVGETGFHFGGFALGFFLGLIGIVVAYVIKDDYKRKRVKWAWIGWGTWVAIYVVALIALL